MKIAIASRLLLFFAYIFALPLISNQARAQSGGAFPPEKLYQLHDDGKVYVNCDGCVGGWYLLDQNPNTVAIAGYGELYQIHNDGSIWHYFGRGTEEDHCRSPTLLEACPKWEKLDENKDTKTIVIGTSYNSLLNDPPWLYQMHGDRSIYRYLGTPCGKDCSSWETLDHNPSTVAIVAGFNGLYQLHDDGKVYRWDGKTICAADCLGWALLDQNSNTAAIAAGHGFYQMHKDGSIWKFTGGNTPCTVPTRLESCPNWEKYDEPNPNTASISAGFSELYKLQKDGKIYRKCESCPGGWIEVDLIHDTVAITVGRSLYQMRRDRSVYRYKGDAANCRNNPGCDDAWAKLDANPSTKGIIVDGSLFSR